MARRRREEGDIVGDVGDVGEVGDESVGDVGDVGNVACPDAFGDGPDDIKELVAELERENSG